MKIPIIRWNNEGCAEPDLCLRLDEAGNGQKFFDALINNEIHEGEPSDLWVRVEGVTEEEWAEMERIGREMV
jgi:hypothetical protein